MTNHNEEGFGKILRELGEIRSDIGSMREQSDKRHLVLANEMSDVRATVARAVEVANEAKRIAERSANDTLTMQRAVMDHTKGIVDRMDRVEKENGEQSLELVDQSRKLDVLIAAATEQRVREDERKRIEDERFKAEEKTWKKWERWKSVSTYVWPALAAVAGYLFHHWKP